MNESPDLEKVLEEFDKKLPCVNHGCDNDGVVMDYDKNGDPEQQQCEYCYRERLPIKDFIRTHWPKPDPRFVTEVSDDTVVRASLECPECIEKKNSDQCVKDSAPEGLTVEQIQDIVRPIFDKFRDIPYEESRFSLMITTRHCDVLTKDISLAIYACKAAVEAAGLEYGLDEKKIADIIHSTVMEIIPDKKPLGTTDFYACKDAIARNLKLAERELIVRKEK